MDAFEPIRRGYHVLGLGASEEVLAMLDQSGPEPACWEVHTYGFGHHSHPAGEAAAVALFNLPPHLELAQVQVTAWSPDERRGRLVVAGHYRARVRGSWDSLELPFSHVWSFADGRVMSVSNVLDGFELRREPACGSA
jgi:ketosteroid isomerase-like protein